MTYQVGDQIVHPMHGAGVIDSVISERINGSTREYYVFKMPAGGLVLKIPVANSDVIGIRPIISAEAAETLMNELPNVTAECNRNWNKRFQENLQRIKSGDLYEVAKVVKSLTQLEQRRTLSTGERKMLQNARQIRVSEVVLASHQSESDIESRVDQAMLSA